MSETRKWRRGELCQGLWESKSARGPSKSKILRQKEVEQSREQKKGQFDWTVENKKETVSLDTETLEAPIHTQNFIFNIYIYILIGLHVSIHS